MTAETADTTETAVPLQNLPEQSVPPASAGGPGPTGPVPPAPPADAPAAPAPTPPAAPPDETDRLDPDGNVVELKSGVRVRILPLKMRQLFRLLRIVTRGGAQYVPMLREAMSGMTSDEDDGAADAFGAQLVAVLVIALPEAENETVDFLLSVCEPEHLESGTTKRAQTANEAAREKVRDELFNPDLDDMITIIEKVVAMEKDDLVALGKRLSQTFRLATKVDPDTQQAMQNLPE